MKPHRVAAWELGAYVVILGFITLWPTPVDRGAGGELVMKVLRRLHGWGVPHWVDYGLVEAASNVLLFMPLGALVVWIMGPVYWWVGAATGLLLSCLIELAQFAFLPARYPSLADVLANTAGATLGALLILLILYVLTRRAAVRNPAPARTL
ncbi:VanZ family protein [Arthrobacter sp. CG_A4]|uniref:VanZ family protein n=1 Tax=Arthrobacter sp. CG_A4 TaxID=3071706 RepID=UPI002DF7411E|nr:VanZ family protein [Arthrobacter sp. CG_A4]